LLFSSLLTLIFWQKPDPKGLVFLSVFFIFGEIWVRIKWRLDLVCKFCGFDPLLYIKSPELAAEKVKAHMDEQKSDPLYALHAHKLSSLPKRKVNSKPDKTKNSQ
jgi:hypothetical protein